MSLLFGDIYEAIRTLRIKKGVSEKDILNYVEDKIGGCMNVANVLKTIKTLNKLVEEGVLIKRGKRYAFNIAKKIEMEEPKDQDCEKDEQGCDDEEPPQEERNCVDDDDIDDDDDEDEDDDDGEDDECKPKEKAECEEDDEPDEDDEDEDDDDGEDDSCKKEEPNEELKEEPEEEPKEEQKDECEGEEEEEEEEDDEEDEDDEDDDDDGCAEKSPPPTKDECEKEEDKEKSSEKNEMNFISEPKVVVSNSKGKSESSNGADKKRSDRKCVASENRDNKGGGEGGGEADGGGIIDSNSEKRTKTEENIAFCFRDFIDSQYRPRGSSESKEKHDNMEDTVPENMDEVENDEDIGKILQERKRKFPTKRSKTSRSKYRSRSPIKKIKAKCYNSLKMELSDHLGYRSSSQYFQEPMDADDDTNVEREKEIEIEYESIRQKSDAVLYPPGSMGDIERRKSGSSCGKQMEVNFPENVSVAKNTVLDYEMKNIESRTFEAKKKGSRDVDYSREAGFSDDDVNSNEYEGGSLCSVCEKTKNEAE